MECNLIGGEWVEGPSSTPKYSPSDTDDLVGEYAQASREQAEEAVAAAAHAFPAWSGATAQQRCDALDAIGSEILSRKQELGALLAREEGKAVSEAVGEAARAGYIFKFFAGEALRTGGEKYPSLRPGIRVDAEREPIGPVGLITPWNFPLAIPAWKIAPALAYGCSVVFKPASPVPACAVALAGIVQRAEIPEGAFNLVMGRGSVVGRVLAESESIAGVSFTGSCETGAEIAKSCAAHHARVQLEMGGKNPMLVLDDADLGIAVDATVKGAFFQTGQRCTASSRIIVTEGVHDRFVEALIERTSRLRVGHALDPETEIGPAVDAAQLQQDLDYIALGREEGANLAFGGRRLERDTPGYYIEPALFTESTNDMRINREEMFGPIAAVIRVRDYEEGVAVANDTPYGLAAGICTTSARLAADFRRRSSTGLVMVNLPTAGLDYHVPFGGTKASSYGPREQGTVAREFFTNWKTCYSYDA